jgi:hypothetical protein
MHNSSHVGFKPITFDDNYTAKIRKSNKHTNQFSSKHDYSFLIPTGYETD